MSANTYQFGPEVIDGFEIKGSNYHKGEPNSVWHVSYWMSGRGSGNVANYIVEGDVFRESITNVMENGSLQFRPRYTGESNVPALEEAAVLKAISKWTVR